MSTPLPEPKAAVGNNPSWSPVLTTLMINAAEVVILYTLFEIWRRDPKKKQIYRARYHTKAHRTPPPPSTKLGGWIWSTLAVSDEETLRCVGLDTFVLLRVLRMFFQIVGTATIFGLLILIPVYYNGNNPQPNTREYNTITMANVRNDSKRLWAPLVFWILFVSGVLRVLWMEWVDYQQLRYKFLAEGDTDSPEEYRYAVLVEDIPTSMRTADQLHQYFEGLFPGQQVAQAGVYLFTKKLEKILAQLQTAVIGYERAVAAMHHKPDKPEPETRVGGVLCCGGEKKKAIEHYESEMRRLRSKAREEYDHLLSQLARGKLNRRSHRRISIPGISSGSSPPKPVTSATGVVSFNSLAAKQAAIQCELTGDSEMETNAAPEPNDILWSNITTRRLSQRFRRTACNILWSFAILFWAIPVTAIQGLANLDGLKEKIPWIWVPAKDTLAYGFLTGYLPVIALMLFMMVVPWSIYYSATKVIKMKSASLADKYTLKWHIGFQVANLWLVLIGGSFIDQLGPLIDDPTSILDMVANAVPSSSQFFLNFLITSTLGGLFQELSGYLSVLLRFIMQLIRPDDKKTQRDLNAAAVPPSFWWGWLWPAIMLQILVIFVYAAIVPIFLPFGTVYFGLSYLVYKYRALNVYAQPNEGGGVLWPVLYHRILACLIIAELIFFAYIGVKGGYAQSILSLILFGCTITVHRHLKQAFITPTKTLALNVANEVDKKRRPENSPLVQVEAGEARAPGWASDLSEKDLSEESSSEPDATATLSVTDPRRVSVLYKQPALRQSQWPAPLPYRYEETQERSQFLGKKSRQERSAKSSGTRPESSENSILGDFTEPYDPPSDVQRGSSGHTAPYV